MIKVLMIGQLPKEVGGNYTTGAANVVYELSKKKVNALNLYIFGTNISNARAIRFSSFANQYIGYRFLIFDILFDALFHPRKTAAEWKHYKNIDHANPLRYAFYKANIKRAISVVRPDIIHVHSIGNISPTRFAIDNYKMPLLLTCHGIFYRGDSSDIIQRDRYLGNIRFANYYSGLTKESLNEYESILGVDKTKVYVVPNGVDCSKFYYDVDIRVSLRKLMNVSDETKVFITVASVQERKGQFKFIKLIEKLPIDCQYWIVGTGPDIPLIQNYIIQKKLDNIKLLGYQSADVLFKYYSAADIYAHVSTKEGQALCEIEANATGLRTIVNKAIVGTIPDLKKGDYFVTDIDNFTDSTDLLDWLNQPTAPRTSRTSFDWQEIAEMYASLYRKIVK